MEKEIHMPELEPPPSNVPSILGSNVVRHPVASPSNALDALRVGLARTDQILHGQTNENLSFEQNLRIVTEIATPLRDASQQLVQLAGTDESVSPPDTIRLMAESTQRLSAALSSIEPTIDSVSSLANYLQRERPGLGPKVAQEATNVVISQVAANLDAGREIAFVDKPDDQGPRALLHFLKLHELGT